METQTKTFPVYELLGHLQHRKIKLAGQLTLELEKAIAASGVGLDHCVGERVLAIGDDSIRDELNRFFMLTDRRLAGRRASRLFHIPLTEIGQVQMSRGLVTAELKIHANATTIDASLAPFVKPLGAYLSALCTVDPTQRTPPARPLPEPTAEELATSEWLNINLALLSPDCAPMLAEVTRSSGAGELNHDIAVDLIRRIFILSRTLQFGRGMQNLWWLSPISTAELLEVFAALFNQPVASYQQGQLGIFDFQLGGSRGAAKAAASTAVGLAALGLLGVGWVSVPRGSIKSLRLTMLNSSGPAHFSLQGFDGSSFSLLSVLAPGMVRKLFEILARYEKEVLMSRCKQLLQAHAVGGISTEQPEIRVATNAKETAILAQATRRVRTKSSTLLIVSREPGTCGTCRHSNQGTADFQEGHVFCQFGGGALPVTHSCDKRMPAFRVPNTDPELYYCYQPFSGNNCTWQKLEDTRVLASDADDEMRNSLQDDVPFIPASTASS